MCAVCGAQNFDKDVQCGVCGHNLAEPKPATSGRLKSVLLHWMTAPFVAIVGILWFWFVDGWTGIFILLSSFALAMGNLGVGPSEADTMRRRWLRYRAYVGNDEWEERSG